MDQSPQGLTPAQERVYRFLQDYIKQHEYTPSYEEIRRNFGYKSLNSVYKHLKQLERRGYLASPWGNQKRVLELVPLKLGAVSIPFLGVVAAGTPIEAPEIPESIEVPETFLGGGLNFALKVRGESMIDEGIKDGDVLIITKQNHADNGQTVVAMVVGEATVKKYYRQGSQIELRPANTKMKPLFKSEEDVAIIGLVVGLLRHYRAPFSSPYHHNS
ncbi:MAG: transcriptional repressor LexA [Deltaproteobacteria bacterium]|nr:transcriptional repressor LexA [Deltaproteobacteria bacterium]